MRLVRGLPDPPVGAVTVLGVDDFAIKRGQNYATVVLDMATHQPIDVLADREADTLADWLASHPELTVITRDRAGSYTDGATRGAPQATQCADRWHLWKNLGEAVEKTVIAHRSCLAEHATANTETPEPARLTEPAVTDMAAANQKPTSVPSPIEPEPDDQHALLRTRTQQRYEAVQQLRTQGKGLRTIADELDIDRKTVRRFAQAASAEEVIAKATSRVMLLDEFIPHLMQRWNAGCTDIATLTAELRQLGYRGSQRTVYRYLQPYRSGGKPAPHPATVKTTPPKIRTVVGWIMRDPDNLRDDDGVRLKQILARCPELDATRRHVGAFAAMIRDLRGDHLTEWIDRVRTDDLPALHSFTTGLLHDKAAVTAGLTLAWSNGPTEGTVNKIKYLKRQCFGRAKLDLLRKRILLTP